MKKYLIALILLVPSIAFAQVVSPNRGGTGSGVIPANGDLLVGSSGSYSHLTVGSNGNCLEVQSGLPAWVSLCGSGTNFFTASGVNINQNTGSVIQGGTFVGTSTIATSTIPILTDTTLLPTSVAGGSYAAGVASGAITLNADQFIFGGGNFGIGSTSPGTDLSIDGSINISGSGTSTWQTGADGINIKAGCFAINSICIGNGGGGSSASSTLLSDNNTFSGSNTFTNASNAFTQHLKANNLYGTTDNSQYITYDNNGDVSIGDPNHNYNSIVLSVNSGSIVTSGAMGIDGMPQSVFDVVGNMSGGSYGGAFQAPSNGFIWGGKVGVSSTTPFASVSVGSGNSILCPQVILATSTSMTVNWNAGCSQLIRLGGSATSIGFSNVTLGATLTLTTCSPGTTAGIVSFTGAVSYSGGIQPGNTTAANQCDVWYWHGDAATSTVKAFLDNMSAGFQ